MLIDNHGRKINYLRLAVTDRCNLRCFYCMPEEGLNWLDRKELMTYEEMLRSCSLLVKMPMSLKGMAESRRGEGHRRVWLKCSKSVARRTQV